MPAAPLSGTRSLRGGATAVRKSERRQATTRRSPGRIAALSSATAETRAGEGISSRPSSTGTMSPLSISARNRRGTEPGSAVPASEG